MDKNTKYPQIAYTKILDQLMSLNRACERTVMMKMTDLQTLCIEAQWDYVSQFELGHGSSVVFLAYIDKDEVEPTIYFFELHGEYARPYHTKVCSSYAEAQLHLYTQYLSLRNREDVYRAHISIPSLGLLE